MCVIIFQPPRASKESFRFTFFFFSAKNCNAIIFVKKFLLKSVNGDQLLL